MTLEEAKKEIKRLADCQLSEFDKNPNQQAWRKARAYENVYDILDEIDTEPVGNPDKMTLRELARELRKLFRFKWLTITDDYPTPTLMLWTDKPGYDGHGWNIFNVALKPYRGSVTTYALNTDLDLSEYRDADGNIDYSRCIVEVADDID